MDKDTLVMLANKLMFTMEDSEYDTLLDEFDTIIKQQWDSNRTKIKIISSCFNKI